MNIMVQTCSCASACSLVQMNACNACSHHASTQFAFRVLQSCNFVFLNLSSEVSSSSLGGFLDQLFRLISARMFSSLSACYTPRPLPIHLEPSAIRSNLSSELSSVSGTALDGPLHSALFVFAGSLDLFVPASMARFVPALHTLRSYLFVSTYSLNQSCSSSPFVFSQLLQLLLAKQYFLFPSLTPRLHSRLIFATLGFCSSACFNICVYFSQFEIHFANGHSTSGASRHLCTASFAACLVVAISIAVFASFSFLHLAK